MLPNGKRSDRLTFHSNDIIPEEGCRLSWVLDVYASGRVRVAAFGRLNMTSNARCGLRVG